ncbi:MAG TPA: hypothetical protein VFI33_15625 [Puia sp.]|nr:hypothetical protein [Puia sp.]
MTSEEIYTEIHSLQLDIEENERKFDEALQDTPSQVELARTIYRNIKVMEGRLSDLRILLDQATGS